MTELKFKHRHLKAMKIPPCGQLNAAESRRREDERASCPTGSPGGKRGGIYVDEQSRKAVHKWQKDKSRSRLQLLNLNHLLSF